MHDCSVQTGDSWLAANVPALLHAGTVVIVTFDEGTTGTNGGGHLGQQPVRAQQLHPAAAARASS
jgi:hypothetical protein